MQVLISSSRAACALSTHSGSASSGRAMEISCTWVSARICSAACGMLIRLDATTGMLTWPATAWLMSTKALLGTDATMINSGFGCQREDVVPALTTLDEVGHRHPVE